jgi:replicative DNA helicase
MNDLDAERAVLGAVLSGWRNLDELNLRPEDFYQPRHEAVFDAALRVRQAGNRPDMVTVRTAIGPQHTNFRGTDVGVYLAELVEACPVVAAAGHYALMVAQAADRRGLQQVTDRMRQAIEAGKEPAEIATEAQKAIQAVTTRTGARSELWSDIDPDVIDHIEKGSRVGIPTPWPDVNHYIGGLVGSRLYTIAGRPGHGKSLVGQALAVNSSMTHNKGCLFASLEMSRLDLGIRIYADQAGIALGSLQSANLSTQQWAAVSKTSQRLAAMGLRISDDPSQTVAQIKSEAKGMKNLGIVVVDYLQLVTSSSKDRDRREQVDEISRNLKLMAKELDVPVVALAQLNRANQQRADHTPQISDLRESGSIEQDSDVVMLLNHDRDSGELKLDVAKNRFGGQGVVNLQMWGHYSRVVQADGISA